LSSIGQFLPIARSVGENQYFCGLKTTSDIVNLRNVLLKKKYQNPFTCVKVIASQRSDVFETWCILTIVSQILFSPKTQTHESTRARKTSARQATYASFYLSFFTVQRRITVACRLHLSVAVRVVCSREAGAFLVRARERTQTTRKETKRGPVVRIMMIATISRLRTYDLLPSSTTRIAARVHCTSQRPAGEPRAHAARRQIWVTLYGTQLTSKMLARGR